MALSIFATAAQKCFSKQMAYRAYTSFKSSRFLKLCRSIPLCDVTPKGYIRTQWWLVSLSAILILWNAYRGGWVALLGVLLNGLCAGQCVWRISKEKMKVLNKYTRLKPNDIQILHIPVASAEKWNAATQKTVEYICDNLSKGGPTSYPQMN